MEKQKKDNPGRSYIEPEMVIKISKKTGVSQVKVKRILAVFRISFKNYLKGPMELPIYIQSVFKIYRGRNFKDSLKTEEQKKNWRNLDNEAPYKK
jgi:hypothetical protein